MNIKMSTRIMLKIKFWRKGIYLILIRKKRNRIATQMLQGSSHQLLYLVQHLNQSQCSHLSTVSMKNTNPFTSMRHLTFIPKANHKTLEEESMQTWGQSSMSKTTAAFSTNTTRTASATTDHRTTSTIHHRYTASSWSNLIAIARLLSRWLRGST